MAIDYHCLDVSEAILEDSFCLSALSKNLQGELRKRRAEPHKCIRPRCVTLRALQQLKVTVTSNPVCDGPLGPRFDDTLLVEELATVFMEGDGNLRGVHAGEFTWFGDGVTAQGRISGITNAGTHREPIFAPCQPCDTRGFMEGRLCGSVVETERPELERCLVVGTYRFRFDSSHDAGSTSIRGTLEAGLVCPCR